MIGVAALGFRISQNTQIHVELVEWEIGNTWRGIGRMQETADLVAFTEEILNGKLHFLCSVNLRYMIGF